MVSSSPATAQRNETIAQLFRTLYRNATQQHSKSCCGCCGVDCFFSMACSVEILYEKPTNRLRRLGVPPEVHEVDEVKQSQNI
jgi:hypothetical protein